MTMSVDERFDKEMLYAFVNFCFAGVFLLSETIEWKKRFTERDANCKTFILQYRNINHVNGREYTKWVDL